MTLEDLVWQIVQAAKAGDHQEVRRLGAQLLAELRAGRRLEPDAGLEAALAFRDVRAFELLEKLGEILVSRGGALPPVRRLLAQALIDQGKAEPAGAVLDALRQSEPRGSAEWAAATGLMGRLKKDAVIGARDLTSASARADLELALAHYYEAYADDRSRVWQGVNALALAWLARRLAPGLALPVEPDVLAREVVAMLQQTPPERRDRWHHATLGESQIALGLWAEVERNIGVYARDPATTAFQLAGTLRQLTTLWRLEDLGERAQGIVATLRAALLSKKGGQVQLDPDQLQRTLARPKLAREQVEAVLGDDGPQTYEWWLQGGRAALSVALVRAGVARGVGSAFAVRGRDLSPALGDELLVLTNAHVVSPEPTDEGLHPSEVRICFQPAADGGQPHAVAEIVWHSPRTHLDASLLRLTPPPADITPLPLSPFLPTLSEKRRVYVIGHPNGGELSISMQDNELLDHEGPPKGLPPDPTCRRVHYRAPTEQGNSGSPVFNSSGWQVIALHHKGGTHMPRLNGRDETYPANEGIWIQSIVEAVQRDNPAD